MVTEHSSPRSIPAGFTATLAQGQALSLPATQHERLVLVLRGRLWLTVAGDQTDHWLRAGDSLALRAGQAAVIEAWPQADFQLLQPVSHLAHKARSCRAAKAGMAAGTRPLGARVLGWLLQRFPVTP